MDEPPSSISNRLKSSIAKVWLLKVWLFVLDMNNLNSSKVMLPLPSSSTCTQRRMRFDSHGLENPICYLRIFCLSAYFDLIKDVVVILQFDAVPNGEERAGLCCSKKRSNSYLSWTEASWQCHSGFTRAALWDKYGRAVAWKPPRVAMQHKIIAFQTSCSASSSRSISPDRSVSA